MTLIPMIRRRAPIAFLIVLAACASDGGAAGGGTIDDREEWCAVIGEVDEQFAEVDSSDDDFEVKQAEYARLAVLIADLNAGIAVVDASDRNAVRTSLGQASRITRAIVAAKNEQDAGRRLESIFAEGEERIADGAPWILANCGIEIDG
jgi:hypothetical protein